MFSPYAYLQYKEDTDSIFEWIANTAERLLENGKLNTSKAMKIQSSKKRDRTVVIK